MSLKRVLVANRGEIAVRIIRACADEGIESVAVVSEADRDSMAAHLADRAVCIGPGPSSESYLDINRVIAAALATGCDSLHPGYGFLAERPELPEACAENGIIFIGPTAETIRRGGDTIQARAVAESLGISTGAGSAALADIDQARAQVAAIGFPVLLKAAAGGGGRGMVLVNQMSDLEEKFASASNEAQQAFGDGRLYVEKFITQARHVEVQILADTHGNVVHLGERDCSAQRRYQKVVEEAPAVSIPNEVRESLHISAVELCGALDYEGAATVEFVVDALSGDFAFLEVNTRIQVEHPVTEMITGIDIVREQLRIAAGEPLSFRQEDIRLTGHAIECRVNAEDAHRNFMPTPGTVTRWIAPVGGGVRIDSHVFGGYQISPYYDSMIAKVLTHGADREEALARMRRALKHLTIEGVTTNQDFLTALISHQDFIEQRHHTRWVEQGFLSAWVESTDSSLNQLQETMQS